MEDATHGPICCRCRTYRSLESQLCSHIQSRGSPLYAYNCQSLPHRTRYLDLHSTECRIALTEKTQTCHRRSIGHRLRKGPRTYHIVTCKYVVRAVSIYIALIRSVTLHTLPSRSRQHRRFHGMQQLGTKWTANDYFE